MAIDYGKVQATEFFWKNNFKEISNKLDLINQIKNSKNHLDFGSGTGYFTKLISEILPNSKITGIEIEKEEIVFAASHYKNKNLQFVCSDQIIGEEKYDSITTMLVLHELKSKSVKKQLSEFYNHLNSQGKLLVYECKKVSPALFKKWYEQNPNPRKGTFEQEYDEHNKWTLPEFKKMCEKAGFTTLLITDAGEFNLAYVGIKK